MMGDIKNQGQCECGQAKFSMLGEPVIRVICHCEICQEFNEADFADITIYSYKDVQLPEKGKVDYRTYAKPPLVQRGKCSACGKPAVEYLNSVIAPRMAIVPTANISDQTKIPEVNFHSFYHRRKKDYDDSADKIHGFLASQLAFMWRFFKAK